MQDNIIDFIKNQERNNFKQTEIIEIYKNWEVVEINERTV